MTALPARVFNASVQCMGNRAGLAGRPGVVRGWDEIGNSLGVYWQNANYSSGLTLDHQGDGKRFNFPMTWQ